MREAAVVTLLTALCIACITVSALFWWPIFRIVRDYYLG